MWPRTWFAPDRTHRHPRTASPLRPADATAAVLLAAFALAGGAVAGADDGSRAGKPTAASGASAKPAPGSEAHAVCSAYNEADYEQALRMAHAILESQAADMPTKIETYKCQACTFVETRRLSPARSAIEEMLRLDPTARFSPDLAYPGKVLEIYHAVWDSLFPGTMDINTIAVGDLEDNSPYKPESGKYDYSVFSRAFVHAMIADLCAASDLKVVDRQRVKQLTDEIALGGSGFADPEQAVKAGRFLGAQSFIFGQYQILSDDEALIEVRVVHTATGEVVMTKRVIGEFSGKPKNLLDLEKQLVLAVAEGLDSIRGSSAAPSGEAKAEKIVQQVEQHFAAKEATIDDRDGYTQGLFLAGEATRFEDEGDFDKAYATWQKVLETDPENKDAALRIRALRVMVQEG